MYITYTKWIVQCLHEVSMGFVTMVAHRSTYLRLSKNMIFQVSRWADITRMIFQVPN